MDHYISLYIDDELTLEEKLLFIEQVHRSRHYTDEAVALLHQEKELVQLFNRQAPGAEPSFAAATKKSGSIRLFGLAAAVSLLLSLLFLFQIGVFTDKPAGDWAATQPAATVPYRFVIFQQDSESVEIAGSFTGWQKVGLVPTGAEGYWEIVLHLPPGEHQYAFVVDGTINLPDPTVSLTESDDFGMVNSIISIEG
jgi:hypothetical protein